MRWRRPSGPTVFILLGLLAYLGLRQLPPDNSLARVRDAGVLTVCRPPALPPYLSAPDTPEPGQEALLVEAAARRIGVPVGWNVQAAWGTSPDPVDWGVRPESCDLLAGGIVVGPETQGLMQLLPYSEAGWALLRTGAQPQRLAVLANHWGLVADDAYDWADRRNLDFLAYETAQEALDAMRAGERDAVLALQPEAAWLSTQLAGSRLDPVSELPAQTLALGLWKNNITLKRAVTASLAGRP